MYEIPTYPKYLINDFLHSRYLPIIIPTMGMKKNHYFESYNFYFIFDSFYVYYRHLTYEKEAYANDIFSFTNKS